MPLATLSKGLKLIDLVMTGEMAAQAGCDRRTFKMWAKRLKVEPIGIVQGEKEVYKRADAERVVKAYIAFKQSKKRS